MSLVHHETVADIYQPHLAVFFSIRPARIDELVDHLP